MTDRKKPGVAFWMAVVIGLAITLYPLWCFIAIYLGLSPDELRELLRTK